MEKIDDMAIYVLVKNAGLVCNQYEFSEFCGRNKTWFSCIKARGDYASITALGIMAARLAQQMDIVDGNAHRQQLRALRYIVLEEMGRRCAERAGV